MDSQYNVESTQETKTTTSSSSDVGLDKIYMKSIDSILKIAEMVLSLIIFICVTSHPGYVYIGGGWVQFVSISCLITVLLLWIFFMLRIIYKLPGPWQLIILIYTIVIVLLLVTSFLVCAIQAVCYDYFGDWNAGLLAGAGSYGFQILIYYIVYLVFYLISFLVCAIQAGNYAYSNWIAGLIAGAILIYYIVYLVFYLISFLVCAIQAGNYAQTGGLIAGAILVYYVAFSVLYLITTIVCIGQSNKMASNGGLIAAAVFCFFILLVMGADTFFQFRKYQESGSGLGTRTVTGGTTTTTTHTTYETRTQY